jgi:hypothetical protein
MTEPSSPEEEAPIQDGDKELEVDTDNSVAPVFPPDTPEEFNSQDGNAWPDRRKDGSSFEDVAFAPEPQLDEGAK